MPIMVRLLVLWQGFSDRVRQDGAMDDKLAKRTARYLSVWVAPVALVFLGALLTGCAQEPKYQDSLVRAAESDQLTLSLPRGEGIGAPIPLWDSVFVVCPYSDTSLVPEPFAEEAETLDTASTDSVQWLLFSGQDEVSRISIKRTTADFCQTGSGGMVFDSAQIWSAQNSEGAWVMTPVMG